MGSIYADRTIDSMPDEAEWDVFQDMPAVWTEPENEWMRRVFAIGCDLRGNHPRLMCHLLGAAPLG